MSEEQDYFADTFDEAGEMLEPKYNVIEVNYRGVLNFVKLATSYMRREGKGGSIVITSSATAYSPEQSLPVYSATKLAVSDCMSTLISCLVVAGVGEVMLILRTAHRTRSRSSLDTAEG